MAGCLGNLNRRASDGGANIQLFARQLYGGSLPGSPGSQEECLAGVRTQSTNHRACNNFTILIYPIRMHVLNKNTFDAKIWV